MEGWIWIIIFIVVAIVKALGKLQSAGHDESTPSAPKARPQRPARPRPRPAAPPPLTAPMTGETWRIEPQQLKEFISQVTRRAQPPPVVPAQVRQPPAPQRKPEPSPAPPAAPAAATESKPSRAALWAEAFRDKQNLRNIVIATEIIGPPAALR
jgi:hypothetical protein